MRESGVRRFRRPRRVGAAGRHTELGYRIARAEGTHAWVLERGQRVVERNGEAWLHGSGTRLAARIPPASNTAPA